MRRENIPPLLFTRADGFHDSCKANPGPQSFEIRLADKLNETSWQTWRVEIIFKLKNDV